MIEKIGWTEEQIDNFATTFSGGTPATQVTEFWNNGTIPWINSGELSKNDYIKEPTTFISKRALKFSSAKLALKHSVGIALTGATTGMVGFYEIETTTNQSIVSILPNKKVDTLYLFHYLKNSRKEILGYNIGSAQPHINKKIVDKFVISFPKSLTEQFKIAEILSTVDRAIEQTEGLISKQQRIKIGLMQDLLTHGIDEQGNLRSMETHQFKDSPLGRIPMEWEVKPLGRVATLQRGFDLPIQDRELGTIPVYGSNGIDGWHNRSPFTGPSVITGRSGSIGYVFFEDGPFWPLNTTLFVKDFHNNAPQFIYLLLENFNLKRFAASTGVPSLNRNYVHPELVMLPPLDEQHKIIRFMAVHYQYYLYVCRKLDKLRSLKTAMMQDLLTGKVRVTPLLEKPEVSK